jgi:hypothetical protein
MLAVVLAATLVPADAPDPGEFQWCVLCGRRGTADALANVLLFLPLAAGLVWSGASGARTVVVGLLFSATLELVQLRLVDGRDSTLGDLVWNTVGTALGVGFAWWFPVRRRSGVAALAVAASVPVVVGLGGVLLRPDFPPTAYVGQVQEDLRVYHWYSGRILRAEIGGLALAAGPLADSRGVRERLTAGAPLSVRTLAGPRTPRVYPIFSIFDTARREILFVGNDRGDLVLRTSTRAADVRLDRPDLRWRGALATVVPGDTLLVVVRRARATYCLGLNGGERCDLAPGAGRLWALLQFSPHLPGPALAGLDGAFLALLGLCVGLAFRRGAAGYAAVALALAGVVVLPPLVGLARTPLVHVLVLGCGILGGARLPPPTGPAVPRGA